MTKRGQREIIAVALTGSIPTKEEEVVIDDLPAKARILQLNGRFVEGDGGQRISADKLLNLSGRKEIDEWYEDILIEKPTAEEEKEDDSESAEILREELETLRKKLEVDKATLEEEKITLERKAKEALEEAERIKTEVEDNRIADLKAEKTELTEDETKIEEVSKEPPAPKKKTTTKKKATKK